MKRIPLLLGFGMLAAAIAFACNNPTSSSASGLQVQPVQTRALPAHAANLQTIAMLQQQVKPDQGTTSPAQSSPPVTSQTPAASNPPTTGATPPQTQASPPSSEAGASPANNAGTTGNGAQNSQSVNNPGTAASPNAAATGNAQQQSNANDQNKPLYERQATDIPWAQPSAGNSNTPPPPH